jgi:ATP-dependent helicase HrpB
MSILPVWELRNEIVESINNGNRLIIRAPTGSGKSTQVPSMLLSSGTLSGQILVLQPRRLAARMLAARVAFERKTELGAEIGFQTRFESSFSELTRVRFITEGILPRLMLTDPDLSSVSAVIFDEFHERSLTVDMGLALIRSLQERARPDLKLIVMSATLEVNPLSEYLAGAKVITTDGRSFPVEIQYYPECSKKDIWAAAAEIAVYLVKQGLPGDILVFMPGIYEIRKTVSALRDAHYVFLFGFLVRFWRASAS